jgi:hypothetical protein
LTAASEKEGSSPETKVTSHTAFWAESKDINVASYLSTRFNEKFEEHGNVRGKLCQTTSHGDNSNSWTKARFFVSSNFVAKVYRILWNPDQPNAKTIFPQALHESAATAFVCRLQKWHCEVFGVFHQGTNAVYLDICLIRTRLNCAGLAHSIKFGGATEKNGLFFSLRTRSPIFVAHVKSFLYRIFSVFNF